MNRFSQHLPILALVTFTLLLGKPSEAQSQAPEITVATWGGIYGVAQEEAVFKPFTKETGIGVRIHHHASDLLPIFDKRNSGVPPWHVVDVERSDLNSGCASGKFQKLDHGELFGPGGVADFIPGLLQPCGVGAMVWSQAVAYDATVYKNRPPRTLADFFDTANFPGRRGMFAMAEGNLEIALMSAGTPPEDVYDILRKPGGTDQAFAILDSIKGDIVFWRSGAEPEQMLNEGRVNMTTAYAARFLRPRQGARRPTRLLWSNQVWRATYWAVPEGHTETANALRFLAFATDPERLAHLATRLWFGPSRRSGLEATPEHMRGELPTARKQFHNALQIDAAFWQQHGAEIEARFAAWRAQQ